MLEGGKISSRQAIFLMVTTISATVILFVPGITAKYARQDSWLSIIMATLGGLLIARVATTLGLRFPDKNIFEYPGDILGEWPGKLVGLLYVFWFLHMNAEVIREYGSFMVAAFMPETPITVFILVVVAIAAYATRNGLEVFSRANEIFLPFIVTSIIILFILLTGKMNFQLLLPVFDVKSVDIFKGALAPEGWFGEIAVIAVVIPYLNKPREAHRVGALAILTCGALLMLSAVGVIALFGPTLVEAWLIATLSGARMINIAAFLDRVEAVIMVIWITGGLIKITVFYWAAVLGSAQILKLNDYRPLVIPIGTVLVAMSTLLHPNISDLLHFLTHFWPPYAIIVFEVGLPLLLLVVSLSRGIGGTRV